MFKKILLSLLVIIVFSILIAYAKQPTKKESPAPKTSTNTITISHFAFEPKELSIKSGTTVTWMNNDSASHNVVSTKLFKSKNLNKSSLFRFKFTAPGKYNYYCGIHPSMKGQIIVK